MRNPRPTGSRERIIPAYGLGARLLLIMVGGAVLLAGLVSAVTAAALVRARDQALRVATAGLEAQGNNYLRLLVDQNTSVNNKELAAVAAHGIAAAQSLRVGQGQSPPGTRLRAPLLTALPGGDLVDARPGRRSDIFVPASADQAEVEGDLESAALLDSLFAGTYDAVHNVRALAFVGRSGLVQTYPPQTGAQPDQRLNASLFGLFDAQQQAPVWLSPYERPDNIGLLTTVVIPVGSASGVADGGLAGVIVIDVSLVFLQLNLEALLPTTGSTAFLIDQRRTLIAATPGALGQLVPGMAGHTPAPHITQTIALSHTASGDLDAGIQHMLFTPDHLPRLAIDTDRVAINGRPFMLAYAPILETGWVVGLLTPIDELTTPATDVSGVILATNKAVMLALLGGAIVFTGLAALAAVYLSRRLTRPLARLAEAATAIGAGDYAQRVPVRSRDEFGQVAAAFNTMSQSIVLANAALRESEERYRLITEKSNDLIGMLDGEERYSYASPSHEHLLGYPPITLIGRTGADYIHPDDRASAHQTWSHAMTANGHAQLTIRYRHANNSWCWIDTQFTPIEHGSARYVLIVGRDITERQRLEAQLLQAQKMESIGRLAGGVAHDFNNLLTAITGYADLLLDALPAADQAHADAREIRQAADRATTLTGQLLAFARKQIIAPRVLNLNDLVADLEKLLRRLIGEDIVLVTAPAPDLGLVRVDPGQIEQLLVNLAVNARDAMPDGGTLTIETANILIDEALQAQIASAPGPYAVLTVSDTGTGIDREALPHLFEPFFTTKEPGQGTGLGLATCYGIVKQHGGAIWVYSEPGQGASFKIYLPCAAGGDAPPGDRRWASPPGRMALPQGSESILLVEDESGVRSLAARVLRDLGYAVLEAASGDEALALVDARAGQAIDLLITDVVMPRISGVRLAEVLREGWPALKVLYMSGYTEHSMLRQERMQPGAGFLQKPFSPLLLAHKVRETLGG